MNNTKKEIIELISDYMDKTLNEGCLVESQGVIKKLIDDEYYLLYNNGGETYNYNLILDESIDVNRGKIIGKYEITAVLKYIKSFHKHIECNGNEFFIAYDESYGEGWYLLNKSLSSYTEDEQKDLLENLKKLK